MPTVKILQQEGHHFLWIEGDLWMWDANYEAEEQEDLAKKAYGDVLVAGYGLGIVQRFLVENPCVDSVLTVELYPEVIDACKEAFGTIYGEILIGDFFRLTPSHEFDCVVGDIWLEMMPRFLNLYKQFTQQAESLLKTGGTMLAWGGDYFEYLLSQSG
jgi:spermidine synthase